MHLLVKMQENKNTKKNTKILPLMEKNKNHELDIVVALLVHLEPPAIMADPVLTLPALALSLKRCVSSDARSNIRAIVLELGTILKLVLLSEPFGG